MSHTAEKKTLGVSPLGQRRLEQAVPGKTTFTI
jgi:hypothetical protein